jgi:hypothetical protein
MKVDIDRLVTRFLTWKLPDSVCADLCVIPHRSGTAIEAKEMIEYLLEVER